MTDAPDADPRCIPTRKNILSAMKALVQHAGPNDSLFFHCECGLSGFPSSGLLVPSINGVVNTDSGHGGQVPDKDGDEVDGWDEGMLDFVGCLKFGD